MPVPCTFWNKCAIIMTSKKPVLRTGNLGLDLSKKKKKKRNQKNKTKQKQTNKQTKN